MQMHKNGTEKIKMNVLIYKKTESWIDERNENVPRAFGRRQAFVQMSQTSGMN